MDIEMPSGRSMTLMGRIHIKTFSQVLGQVPMICYHRFSNVFKSRSRGKVDNEWFFRSKSKNEPSLFEKEAAKPDRGFWIPSSEFLYPLIGNEISRSIAAAARRLA